MSTGSPKSDWKHFKIARERALQRLCQRALDDLASIAADTESTPHERYLEIFRKINAYDRNIATGLDILSRSRMLQQIAFARSLKLIEDDEMRAFSQELRDTLSLFGSR